MYQTLLLSSSLFILHVMGTTTFFAHHGRRVCGRDLRHSVVMATESYVQPVHKPYITLCQGHRLCSTYKTVYSVAYRQVSRAAPSSQYYPECCPGWRRVHSHNCNQALCGQPCVNGGTCLRPNQCACPLGWMGRQCQTDVDECSEQHPCTQECVNTAGSYQCTCRDGFKLMGDGRSCRSLPPPPLPPTSTPSQTPVGGHTDAGKRAAQECILQNNLCVFHQQSVWKTEDQDHSQPRGPLLLLVRAMPLSTRTVSNNALRLVPTPDRCVVVGAPCGETGTGWSLIMTRFTPQSPASGANI